MGYPSLLFSGNASGHTVAASVFEDVKLNLFFSKEAIDAMERIREAFLQGKAYLEL